MGDSSKTDTVRTRIFKAILYGDYLPGGQLPAEREMSERTGTSRVTVRRAYEQLEAAGILRREQGRGTFVAKHTAGNQESSNQIALLINVDSPFSLEFIQAVEREVTGNDMLLILRLTDETPEKDEQTAIELVGKGVVNLIIWPSASAFPSQIFGRLRVLGANMVFFDRMLPGPYADYVGLDNEDAMARLFSCASQSDLANPVFVTHSDLIADSDKMREDAFMKNCLERGLKGQIVALPFKADFPKLPERLLKASAIFCVNDDMAARLQPRLKGRLLFGIDGLSDSFISYRQPMAEMAKAAVAALMEQQRKGSKWKTSKRFFKGELINK